MIGKSGNTFGMVYFICLMFTWGRGASGCTDLGYLGHTKNHFETKHLTRSLSNLVKLYE